MSFLNELKKLLVIEDDDDFDFGVTNEKVKINNNRIINHSSSGKTYEIIKNESNYSFLDDREKIMNKIFILIPKRLEDCNIIINQIKIGNIVCIDLSTVETNVAISLVNYLTGGMLALDGRIENIGRNSFVLVPHNIRIERYERRNDAK